MKITAYLVIQKNYGIAISASQDPDEILVGCEEYNQEYHGDDYLSQPRDRTVVTVEFDVPDSVFERPTTPVFPAKIILKET